MGENGTALSVGELNEYVESIDSDLADLEADLYDDEDEEYDEDDEDDEEDEDEDEDDEEGEDIELDGALLYECPHCHETVELDPEELDLEEEHACPNCGKELFPELPEEVDE